MRKVPSSTSFFDVAVSRRDEPDVDLDRIVRADSLDLSTFQHAQQFDLRRHGQIAHFVEKQRSAVCELKTPFTHSIRAGVEPFSWPKSSLSKIPSDSAAQLSATNDDADAAVVVDGAGDQFLTRTILAQDQHGSRRWSRQTNARQHLVHRERIANHSFEPKLFIELPTQLKVRTLQPLPLGCLLNHRSQFFEIEWLGQIGDGTLLHRRHGCLDGTMTGHDNDFALGQFLAGVLQDVQPSVITQHQVGDDDVVFVLMDPRDRVGTVVVTSLS